MPGRRVTRREGRALLVAEAPPRGARPGHRALDGMAGDRLGRYLLDHEARIGSALPRDDLLARFDAVNLLGRWPGSNGKGASWDRAKGARAAKRLPLRGVVVLLGWRVASAYGRAIPGNGALWSWRMTDGGAWVIMIPHPSGVNHTYNQPAARSLAARALREAEALAKLGARC